MPTCLKNGDDYMYGTVSNEEREMFRDAYKYFANHSQPPANQDVDANDWWETAATEIAALDHRWKGYPLMRKLLLAIYDYMGYKAKEKTKEVAEFVLES